MCNKMDMYLERLAQNDKEAIATESFFDNLFESIYQDGFSKERLKEAIDCYDIFHLYHLMFEMFENELSKGEYINLKNRYVRTFDLDIVPLPDCCKRLDKKWGLKNV